MRADLRRRLIADTLWLVTLSTLVLTLILGPLLWLRDHRDRVRSGASQVKLQEQQVEGLQDSFDSRSRLVGLETALDVWRGMIDDESSRIAQLSAAAREAGVKIVSLESTGKKLLPVTGVVSCSHIVRGIGNYRQLARFLDRICAEQEMVAVDQLEIREENDSGPGVLNASFQISWYAAATGSEMASSGKESL